jgi:hypothetical protein
MKQQPLRLILIPVRQKALLISVQDASEIAPSEVFLSY